MSDKSIKRHNLHETSDESEFEILHEPFQMLCTVLFTFCGNFISKSMYFI